MQVVGNVGGDEDSCGREVDGHVVHGVVKELEQELEQGARWQEGLGPDLDALEVELPEVELLVELLALEALEALEAEMLIGLVVELESHLER